MQRLWQKFADRYGQNWAKNFPSKSALGEWARELADFTLPEIAAGFAADGGRRQPFPPSSSQFAGLCAGEDQMDTASVLADVITWLEPPHPWVSDIAFSAVSLLGQSNVKAMKLEELKRVLPAAIKAVKRNGIRKAPAPVEPEKRIAARVGPKQTETGYAWIRQIREQLGISA